MRVAINTPDNSVCFIEKEGYPIPAPVEAMEKVKIVEIDPVCFTDIDEEQWTSMFYDEENNTLYKDPYFFNLSTGEGKAWLIEELTKMSLIPVSARTEAFIDLKHMATLKLGEAKVEEILADDLVTDEEIEDIMSYLNNSA